MSDADVDERREEEETSSAGAVEMRAPPSAWQREGAMLSQAYAEGTITAC